MPGGRQWSPSFTMTTTDFRYKSTSAVAYLNIWRATLCI